MLLAICSTQVKKRDLKKEKKNKVTRTDDVKSLFWS